MLQPLEREAHGENAVVIVGCGNVALRLRVLPSPRADKVASKRFEESASPDRDEQCDAKEQHCVEADAAPASPVRTVFKVEPERELIERERCADAIEQRHQPTRKERRRFRPRAYFDQETKSDNQEDENSPHQVMDMRAADVNVVKWTEVARGGVSHQARQRKGKKESHRGEEQPALGAMTNMLVKQFSDARMVENQEHQCGG